MTNCFDGIGQLVVTFETAGIVVPGQPVAVSGNRMISPCRDGEKFCGIAANVSSDGCYANAILSGYVTASYTGNAPVNGYAKILANGAGGVKVDENGLEVLVCDIDNVNKTMGFFM